MQRQLEKVFQWVEEKYDDPDIEIRMYKDFSGDFIYGRDNKPFPEILFAFDHILDVTKSDVDKFEYDNWLRAR